MANIDVSELLSDPDFVDEMSIISRSTQVNSRGENILKEVSTPTVGSIQPASGKTIQRLPEALRIASVMSFWIKTEIALQDPCSYTEVLVFRGRRYQVQMVFDWANWGAGYCEGVCVAEKPS